MHKQKVYKTPFIIYKTRLMGVWSPHKHINGEHTNQDPRICYKDPQEPG
jgi:hypothetical protein